MSKFITIQSDNINLKCNKVDIVEKIESFKTSLENICGDVNSITEKMFPELFFRGRMVFLSLSHNDHFHNGYMREG